MMYESIVDFCRLSPEPALRKGRCIRTLRNLCNQLEVVDFADIGNLDKLVQTAVPVTIDRISARVPAVCGQCNAADFFSRRRSGQRS